MHAVIAMDLELLNHTVTVKNIYSIVMESAVVKLVLMNVISVMDREFKNLFVIVKVK